MNLTIRVRDVVAASGTPRIALVTALINPGSHDAKEWAGTLTIDDKTNSELRAAAVKMISELAEEALA